MDLTPKQQTSEAIRQADSILILTGQHPSVDQVVAVISLAMILKKYGKQVTPVISDALPPATSLLETAFIEKSLGGLRDFVLKLDVTKAEVDKLRYEMADGKLNVIITPFKGNFAPSDVTFGYGEAQGSFDLAIVLGVPTRARIDRVFDQNSSMFADIPVINLDFHRSNENYGAVNLIDSNASSLCEILVALSESLQGGIIDADIATPLLMGLIASTDRFTATHTTSKSLTVAAQMMAAGAKQQAVVRALYRDGNSRGENRERTEPAKGSERRREPSQPGRTNEPRRESAPESRRDSAGEPRREAATERPMRAEATEPRRETSEPRREVSPEPRRDAVEPRRDVAENGRDREVDFDLPIIPPSHIEMSEPDPAQYAPQPAMEPQMAAYVESLVPAAPAPVAPATFAAAAVVVPDMFEPAPQPAAPVPAVVAPGQLPPEMSPLVDLGVQPVAIHPDQADLGMPLPSVVRDNG